MSRKYVLYRAATYIGVLVGAIGLIAAYTGNAEPIVSASEMPGEPWYAFVGIAVLMLFAGVFGKFLTSRSWTAMGKRANFTPESGSILGRPDLTASLHGRPLRVRTITRKTGSSNKGSKHVTYTVVEADLEEPTDASLMLGRAGEQGVSGMMDVGSGGIQTHAVDDEYVVVGSGSQELAEDLLTTRVRNALSDSDNLGKLTIGDPSGTIVDALPEGSGSFLGGMVGDKMAEKLEEKLGGSETTVANETKGVLLDPHELSRQAEAVAALADTLEDAEKA